MQLQRLVLDFRKGELVVRCLYRRSFEDAPDPRACYELGQKSHRNADSRVGLVT